MKKWWVRVPPRRKQADPNNLCQHFNFSDAYPENLCYHPDNKGDRTIRGPGQCCYGNCPIRVTENKAYEINRWCEHGNREGKCSKCKDREGKFKKALKRSMEDNKELLEELAKH